MMREILFHGKQTDGEKWVEGNLIRYLNGKAAILELDGLKIFSVDPDTVGQFTGWFDRNGKRIFEGDVAAAENGKRYEIKFAEGSFYLDGTSSIIRNPNKLTINRFTIIGNIHDHPEWIGGGL